ncbi:MAG TPA: uroporphyrinogen decarboxylase [Niabella sp.]|nr:uroporphyrinogen decarboxylase [Niabella sp.]HOZ96284.1 uroporphyrinogen decarboxylase [Niabella sp.]HQW14642.1 uroporphyrinogen decarboxylase [Niabella sp.]HQX19781.1 uroporphyrinogen decarboxylase [Niabella sp.]HQX41119.1 uroporphyrinogen decarboxylase [Niabella sp.]
MQPVDIVGYTATILLVISFVPRKVLYIRGINFFACIFFVIYGIMLGTKWPIIISNGIIAGLHLFYLINAKRMPTKQ